MTFASDSSHDHPPHLSVWDGISIVIGIVVGVSIFKTPPLIFSNVSGPWQMFGAWTLGGLLSLIGALCYAELGATYPFSGGDYAYLKRAYGSWVGFLFGWAQLAAILSGSIGAMAYVFADYAAAFLGWPKETPGIWLATAAVSILAILNILGARVGKTLQNILTIAKVAGLVAVVAAGFWCGGEASLNASAPPSGPGLGLAMIFVLYTFGGWNDAAYVATEVHDRQRNIPRVLILGILAILAIYLLVNFAYLWALGFDGVRDSRAPAADVLGKVLGDSGARGVSLLVMISALGAINGLLFTGSRIYASIGADHPLFGFLRRRDPRRGTPVWSLLLSAATTVLMMVVVGTESGRGWLDAGLAAVGLSPLPWKDYGGGFDTLVAATAPVFWGFFLLTGLAVFALREQDRRHVRPFSVPFYPFTPFVFCLTSVYMLYSSLTYAKQLSLIGLVPLALGIPMFLLAGGKRVGSSPMNPT